MTVAVVFQTSDLVYIVMFLMICLIVVVLAKVVIWPPLNAPDLLIYPTEVDASDVSSSQTPDPISGKFYIATEPHSRVMTAKLCS